MRRVSLVLVMMVVALVVGSGVALAVAGAVGFSIGNLADLIRFSIPIIGTDLGEAGSIAITGTVGGASLGAALAFLESREFT